MFHRIKKTILEYPGSFWVLISSTFVDRFGGTILFPFFTLYITERFNVGMTEAGALLGVFAVAGVFGGLVGGALSDRFGRKRVLLFGLLASGAGSLVMVMINQLSVFFIMAGIAGFLGDIGGPARMAMVADLLPEEKRASGYGMMRVAGNLAWVAGPPLGGLLAMKSFALLFFFDAVTSFITAVIVWFKLPETKPVLSEDKHQDSFMKTITGYKDVFRDKLFMVFILLTMIMLLVYQQLYAAFPVYLRDVHGFGAAKFGYLMSINAFVVVAFQFRTTRMVRDKPPMLMMALGTACFLIGYLLFGFIRGYVFFILTVLLITLGEMVVIPVGQALTAKLSPEKMRGRYMGMYNLSWSFPYIIGPWAAGLIMDNFNPNLLWYICGAVSVVPLTGFFLLYRTLKKSG